MRIKMTLAYDGTAYEGSQVQLHTHNTVMGTLQLAMQRLRIDTDPVASGRTDTGVHASGQVVHCDLPAFWTDLEKLRRSLNHQLPVSIRIRHITPVADDFHARFSAKSRIYRYVIGIGEPNPFESAFVTFVPALDFERLQKAIRLFEGTHDFGYFKKTGSETPHDVRTVFRAFAYRRRGKVVLHFEANSYLRSQIRLMVSFLLAISEGRASEPQLLEQLAMTHRHIRKPAPHNGLYLARIRY